MEEFTSEMKDESVNISVISQNNTDLNKIKSSDIRHIPSEHCSVQGFRVSQVKKAQVYSTFTLKGNQYTFQGRQFCQNGIYFPSEKWGLL